MGYRHLGCEVWKAFWGPVGHSLTVTAFCLACACPGSLRSRVLDLRDSLLGGSRLVISGVIIRVAKVITHIRGLVTPLRIYP